MEFEIVSKSNDKLKISSDGVVVHIEKNNVTPQKPVAIVDRIGDAIKGFSLVTSNHEKIKIKNEDVAKIDELMPVITAYHVAWKKEQEKKGLMVLGGIIAFFAIVGALSGGEDKSKPTAEGNQVAPASLSAPSEPYVPPPPTPNYTSKDGKWYLYSAEVSENDQKAGVRAGNVLAFSFVGKVGDEYKLRSESLPGAIISCTNPCETIKVTMNGEVVQRMQYDSLSVIGMAFKDAFNGLLEPPTAAKK